MKNVTAVLSLLLIASPTMARQNSAPLNSKPPAKGAITTAKSQPNPSPVVVPPPVSTVVPLPVPAPALAPVDTTLESKLIHYGKKDVVKLNTKLRFTTMIILPTEEKILDGAIGDSEFWVLQAHENIAYVKPAKAAAQTNLNLITASANVYSFSLVEVSDTPDVQPDLKVFVELKDELMIGALNGPQRFASAAEIEKYKLQAAAAKEETQRIKQITDETIEKGVAKIFSKIRCGYKFKKNKKPFYVSTICHDDRFTYLSMAPEETPTLYDMREGENLVNFSFKPTAPMTLEDSRPNSGILQIQKIVRRGYIAIGKERLYFSIEE